MNETKKMNQIRKNNGYDIYFSGDGIDIGCGLDVLDKNIFNNITSIKPYDLDCGDANLCYNLEDNYFDFVYSSHCLEHMVDVKLALKNWIRICKPNGYIVVAVPHEIYYEKNQWPSMFNEGHNFSFRLEEKTVMPKSILVQELLANYKNIKVISCHLMLQHFDPSNFWRDQTMGDAICQIEFVLKKIIPKEL